MKIPKNSLMVSTLLALILSSCSPGTPPPPTFGVEQAAATLVAMTFQAATRTAAAPHSTNTPAATPTSNPPLFYISGNVNCRTGTGPNFRVVAALTPGTTVVMLGRDPTGNYWLVRTPDGSASCWLQTIDGTPGGSYGNLPAVTPQPSTQKPPAVPAAVSYPFFCNYNSDGSWSVTTSLSWIDPANNANGFRIYRSGSQIADLPATTKTFKETVNVVTGTRLTYSLEAYNDTGVSPQKTISFGCQ